MASLPPQQPQRRSPNRQQTSDESAQQIRRRESEANSSSSLDSQTVLLDRPASSTGSTDFVVSSTNATADSQQPPPVGDDDPDRCWICFGEPSEDKEPRAWRHPCKCALPAHEACLLDWIADLESPDSNKAAARHAEIRCPNCQSEIRLARPKSHAVELYGLLENLESKALLPATVAGLSYMLLLAFSHHGAHSIRAIFGDRDASIILRPRPYASWNWFERQTAHYFPNAARPFWREWRGARVELGLPLIPLALIASRTRLGDAALPFLPIAFFATHPISSETLHIGYWPPSAALSLVILPYIRSAYNEGMERVWGERERGWAKEVKPNLGERDGSEEGEDVQGDDRDDGNGEDVIEIQVGLEIGGEEDQAADELEEEEPEQPTEDIQLQEEDQPQEDIADTGGAAAVNADGPRDQQRELQELGRQAEELQRQINRGLAQHQNRNQDQNQNQGQGQNQNQNRQQNGQRHDFERHFDLIKSAHSVAETVFGALLFPTISSVSGELLRMLLPVSWVTLPSFRSRGPTGLLQTKWGRSIVGGCLFVVLKDAFRIYCRWRAAVSFRERRVRDFDKKRGVYL